MKKITLLFVLLFAGINPSIAQGWDWFFAPQVVVDEENGSFAYSNSMVNDPEGNVYINWNTSDPSITFGDQTFTCGYNGRTFIVKFDSAGNILRIDTPDAASSIAIWSIISDAAGNIYATGQFNGSYSYQGFTFSTPDNTGTHGFILKMDSNGTVLWTKFATAEADITNSEAYNSRFVMPSDIAIAPDGSLYMCGQVHSGGRFGEIEVPIQGETDTFIAKYDANGNALWVRSIPEYWSQSGQHVVCDSSGNAYISGSHGGDGTITLGGNAMGGDGADIIYLVKYNSTGDTIWTKTYGGNTTDDISLYSFSIDGNDNIYSTGYTNYASLFFDDVTITNPNPGQIQGFISKHNSDGEIVWAKGTNAIGAINDVIGGNDGSVYILGGFQSPSIILGGITMINEGTSNSFIAKMDADGNYLWAEQIGGSLFGTAHMAVNEQAGSIAVTSSYNTIRLGNQIYTAATQENLFLAKYNMDNLATTDFNKGSMSLYPNPAKNILNINNDPALGQNYVITDMTGRTIKSGIVENTIDVSSLSSGLYTFTTNNKTVKFVKE